MTEESVTRLVADGSGGVEVAGVTDRGTVRAENQDVWDAVVRLLPLEERTPPSARRRTRIGLVVADGMGGHAGGREAAQAAVEAAIARLQEDGPARELVQAAVHDANEAVLGIRDLIGGDPGTTLVVAVVDEGQAHIGNVGDSRAYFVRAGDIAQLTSDHTWVGEEVRAGRLSAEEARHHPRRNLITRAVMGAPVAADLSEAGVRSGDTLLLCTDGVWEPLSDEDIAALVSDAGPLARDLERLCEAALDAGGRDNVTAVALRVAGTA